MAEDFSNLLQKYMDEWGHGTTILASEASIRLRAAGAPELPRATIDNWLRGTVKRVRDWRSIVAIADVFFLDEEAANKLLKVADHREIRELWNIATEKERRLLRWIFYTPDQRLRPPEPFVGRQEELNQLQKDLKPGQVVALCGPGGIGKTALAAKAIWPLFPDRFPDGVVNFNFYKQPESSLAFEHIAWSFGEEVGSAPRAAAQRALSRRRRALLILDGTENAVDLPAVLDICGHCAVLIISRRRQDGIAAAEMRRDVPRLPRSEAVRLLQVTGGNWAKDTRACERICDLVGDLPLAVWLVGCYLNAGEAEEAADYLTRLEQEPLLTLDQRVSQLLQQSLSQVSEKACEVLAIAGALALAPFSREVIAAAWTGGSNVGPALGELVNYGLLRRIEQRYEVAHTLIHTYTHAHLKTPIETFERLAAHYTWLTGTETKEGLSGYKRLDYERRHIMAVLAEGIKQKAWHATQNLAQAVNQYFDIRGYTTEQVIALEQGLQAAQILGCRTEEGEIWGRLGTVHRLLGQIKTAIQAYEQAWTIAQELGDRHNVGYWMGNQGIAYRDLGRVEQAKAYHEKARDIAREVGDRCHEGYWLGQLGIDYRDGGEANQAIQYYEQALAIAQEAGDRRNEGYWRGTMGTAYLDLGLEEEAIKHHNQALSIAREIGDRRTERLSLGYLGIAYSRSNKIETAINYCEQALTIAHEIGDHRGEAANLGNLGHIYKQQRKWERAIEYFQQALAINREVGNRRREGADLGGLGEAYYAQGKTEQAIESYKQALTIACEIGDHMREALHSWKLGELYENSDPVQAVRLMSVRVAYEQKIDHPHAGEHARQVEEIWRRIEDAG